METDEKKINDISELDITEKSIERIRNINSEFDTLKRIFFQQTRKLEEVIENINSDIERSI